MANKKIISNSLVDKYLIDGCMRCKFGGTLKCKVHKWSAELDALRKILLKTKLKEEIKWGVPVYTLNSKNVVMINCFKNYTMLGFFKGVMMKDKNNILEQNGNTQQVRVIKFTSEKDIKKNETVLTDYILEAIEIENSGVKVDIEKKLEPTPIELLDAFKKDNALKKAFYNLTPGEQRAYIIHFSQAKQPQTRISRIEKYKQQILNGIGIDDEYRMRKVERLKGWVEELKD